MLPGTFDYGFGMALMVKDVRLCLAEAEDFGIPVEVDERGSAAYGRPPMTEYGGDRISPSSPRRSRSAPASPSARRNGAMSDDIQEVYAVRYAEHQRKARRTTSSAIRTTR